MNIALLQLQQKVRLGRIGEAEKPSKSLENPSQPPSRPLAEQSTPSLAERYLDQLESAQTRRCQLTGLRRIASVLGSDLLFDWLSLNSDHCRSIRDSLVDEGLSPASVNRYMDSLRQLLRYAWPRAVWSVERVKEGEAARRNLTLGEVRALIAACDGGPGGARDAALIGALYAGLSAAEAVACRLHDWAPAARSLAVGIKRLAFIVGASAMFMEKWARLRGVWPGPLFAEVARGGVVYRGGMTPQAVHKALRKRCRQAGIPAVTPIAIRRAMEGAMKGSGVGAATVAMASGRKAGRCGTRMETALLRAYERIAL